MRLLALACCVVSLTLCLACSPDHSGISTVFDPCAGVPILLHPGATAAEGDALDEALTLWRSAANATAYVADDVALRDALRIEFQDAAPMFYGVYDDERAIISVNHRLPTEGARTITIAHELGHAFGLDHVARAGRRSIMNPHNLDVTPTEGDVSALTALWGACPARSLD